jgi:hypothetical protein
VKSWPDTTVTIDTAALVSGSLRTFYGNGEGTFGGITIKGNQSAMLFLNFSLIGPGLFGTKSDSGSASGNVTIQPCDDGERFDPTLMVCECATGYGLVVETHACELCSADEVVPQGGGSCTKCPPLSAPSSLYECECQAVRAHRLRVARAARCAAAWLALIHACAPSTLARADSRLRPRDAQGYFGALMASTGVCTQCPADMYRSADDDPAACVACPATSRTFALGATSAADCMCGAGTFGRYAAGNFSCEPVPSGGWSPLADPRLLALEGHWRPNGNYTKFFSCNAGMCLQEQPVQNGMQPGYACRKGHTGHLCGVCLPDYAYQGCARAHGRRTPRLAA